MEKKRWEGKNRLFLCIRRKSSQFRWRDACYEWLILCLAGVESVERYIFVRNSDRLDGSRILRVWEVVRPPVAGSWPVTTGASAKQDYLVVRIGAMPNPAKRIGRYMYLSIGVNPCDHPPNTGGAHCRMTVFHNGCSRCP